MPTGRILLVEDRPESLTWFKGALGTDHDLVALDAFEDTLARVRSGAFDLMVVSLGLRGFDGLRLCSQLRSLPEGRNVPILVLVGEGDRRKLHQAIEMGVNDYLMRPVDRNELVARVRTQLRKKRYADALRKNVDLSVEMAVTDPLTGLHNRRYMVRHLETLMASAAQTGKSISFLIIDVDHFKAVNDTHGHAAGDDVLRALAARIGSNIRAMDMACRYGGEEFVVIMPETEGAEALRVAERLRHSAEAMPFKIGNLPGELHLTVSIGIAGLESPADTAEALLERADQALYRAKHEGRNRVVAAAA
jgi:two-component system cell cycle response regulator